jgi:hypothetical protein
MENAHYRIFSNILEETQEKQLVIYDLVQCAKSLYSVCFIILKLQNSDYSRWNMAAMPT